jgi:hypothetical protein
MRGRIGNTARQLALATLAVLVVSGCRHAADQHGGARSLARASRPPAKVALAPPATNLACDLLTKSDAEDVLGGGVDAPVTSIVPALGLVASRCGYVATGTKPARVVTLLATTWQNPADAKHAFERAHAMSQSTSGQAPETLSGLGDRAYWAGGTASQLHVLVGGTWMVFSGTAGPGVDPRPQCKAAAEKAVAHQRS